MIRPGDIQVRWSPDVKVARLGGSLGGTPYPVKPLRAERARGHTAPCPRRASSGSVRSPIHSVSDTDQEPGRSGGLTPSRPGRDTRLDGHLQRAASAGPPGTGDAPYGYRALSWRDDDRCRTNRPGDASGPFPDGILVFPWPRAQPAGNGDPLAASEPASSFPIPPEAQNLPFPEGSLTGTAF